MRLRFVRTEKRELFADEYEFIKEKRKFFCGLKLYANEILIITHIITYRSVNNLVVTS